VERPAGGVWGQIGTLLQPPPLRACNGAGCGWWPLSMESCNFATCTQRKRLLFLQPRLLEPARSDPEVRAQHVPAVFPSVREGHRLH
jgi:hypothetical protein